MTTIKPTKNEVFNELRAKGCTWCGGRGCECYSRQMKSCYEDAEKRLTKAIKTDEEIKADIAYHEKLWSEIDSMMNDMRGD